VTISPDNCRTYVFPGDTIEIFCSGDCPPRPPDPPPEDCPDNVPGCIPPKPQYGCESRIEISVDFKKGCQ
jgi:hypothetical protein